MTAADGGKIIGAVDKVDNNVSQVLSEVRTLSGRLTNVQRALIDVLEVTGRIDEGLVSNRYARLEIELQDDEKEKEIAAARLVAIEEKLERKKSSVESVVADTGKMKAAARSVHEDIARQKKDDYDAWVLSVKRDLIKALIITGGIGTAGGIVSFIWWLVLQYLNR